MIGRNIRVRFDYDLTDFQKKAEAARQAMLAEESDMVKYAAQVFANAASKAAPPNIGKSTIDKRFYERPFLVLIRLVRGGYAGFTATEEDREQLRNGMVYKILNTKKGSRRGTTFAYCKTKAQLKKLRRIENRGLAKVMWGKELGEIGENVPVGIQRLIHKSRNLEHLNFNKVTFEEGDDKTAVEIENKAENSRGWGGYSESAGYKAAQSALRMRMRKIAEKQREL